MLPLAGPVTGPGVPAGRARICTRREAWGSEGATWERCKGGDKRDRTAAVCSAVEARRIHFMRCDPAKRQRATKAAMRVCRWCLRIAATQPRGSHRGGRDDWGVSVWMCLF